jgi:hypothetical protein
MKQEGIDDAVPPPLKNILGNSYICQVKFNELTRGQIWESFTVNHVFQPCDIEEKVIDHEKVNLYK